MPEVLRSEDGATESGAGGLVSAAVDRVLRWKGKKGRQAAVYGNRRRLPGNRGKRLLRRRGELLERTFAHV